MIVSRAQTSDLVLAETEHLSPHRAVSTRRAAAEETAEKTAAEETAVEKAAADKTGSSRQERELLMRR